MSRTSRASTQSIDEIDETHSAEPVLADSVADQLAAADATKSKGRSRRAAAATQPPTPPPPPPPPEADEVSVVSSTSSKTRGCITTLAELSLDEQTERKRALAAAADIYADIIGDCYEQHPAFTREFKQANLDIIELVISKMTEDEVREKLADLVYPHETETFRTSTRKNKDPAHDGKRVAKKTPPAKAAAESAPASPVPQATA
jgi:hypothetical protein